MFDQTNANDTKGGLLQLQLLSNNFDPIDIQSLAAKALKYYGMLDGVSRLGVAVSGGADSLTLLKILHELNLSETHAIELVPIHINQYGLVESIKELKEAVFEFGLYLTVIDAPTTDKVSHLSNEGKSPCRVCAPIRKKAFDCAVIELELDALALGHHLSDAIATLIMNMVHRGQIAPMPACTTLKISSKKIVRPLYWCSENLVKSASPFGAGGLFSCGMCSELASERARVTKFVNDMLRIHKPSRMYLEKLLTSFS